jgi:hypothetical protein
MPSPSPQRRRSTGRISVPVDSELLGKLERHAKARNLTVEQLAVRVLTKVANAPIRAQSNRKSTDGALPALVTLFVLAGLVAVVVWKAGGFH